MDIDYIRSSSYNNWDFCQMQYYLTYVLGIQKPTPKSADKGTVVHKVMESLALLNKNKKLFGKYAFSDDVCGNLEFSDDEWNKETKLSNTEVIIINNERSNPYTYKSSCKIQYPSTRVGVDVIKTLFDLSYNYYSSRSPVKWNETDRKDCWNWTWIPLEYKDGIFDPRKLNIVDAEPHFDLDVGQFSIKGTIDLVTSPNDESIEIVDWKGLPIDTKIPTPNGWSTMGDLKVGDFVFDKDGNTTKVLGKSQVKYKSCYRITFDDKNEVICDDEHLWLLSNNKVVQITELKVGDKIDIAKPVSYSYKELPIDPYVFGLWLGDGRSRNGELSNSDDFIFNEVKRRGYKLGKNISSRDVICKQRTIFGLVGKLKNLGVINNKHIPRIYLESSLEQRLQLLQGLMDSDGNANIKRKQAVFTSCNKLLSDNVKELLLSLGQRPSQANIDRFIFEKNIKIYPISFRPININPFLLPRKRIKIDSSWGSGYSSYRTVKKIEILSDKKYTQCIMVDSPSSTYLCTENMIPTHNTGQRKNWATGKRKDYASLCNDFQLMLYFYAAKRLYPQYKYFSVTIFFIRDGGPFTVSFEDEHVGIVEEKLNARYKEILNSNQPMMCDPTQNDVKCEKFCEFFKMKGDDGTNLCRFLHDKIAVEGIDAVTEKYKHESHSTKNYKAPGE